MYVFSVGCNKDYW